jgi:hypothetical protein
VLACKAVARAHRWKRMLESGAYASIGELAEAEKINQSYLCRVLRLSLLAPDIIEGALNGALSPEFTLERAMRHFCLLGKSKRGCFSRSPSNKREETSVAAFLAITGNN